MEFSEVVVRDAENDHDYILQDCRGGLTSCAGLLSYLQIRCHLLDLYLQRTDCKLQLMDPAGN